MILFGVAATKHYLGDRGLYVAAVISGLTDMDAITLSTAQLANAGRINATLAWRLILVAALANTTFKAALVLSLGAPRLGWRIALLFAATLAGGILILILWPDDAAAQWLNRLGRIAPTTSQPTTAP